MIHKYKEKVMKKKRVGILFGGKSAEHEISIKSAGAIVSNLDRDLFEPVLIFINRAGNWSVITEDEFKNQSYSTEEGNSFIPWNQLTALNSDIDIYFPVLHGPNGEDGKLQHLLEMSGKPFAGANGLSSAIAMDKGIAKTLFEKAGMKTPGFAVFTENNYEEIKSSLADKMGYPVFVKPCSLGSSVGISKVKNESELKEALDLAFSYEKRVIIEEGLDVREIELSVMGNPWNLKVSVPGELIPCNEFYDYEDKYIKGATGFNIPAKLSEEQIKEVQDLAKKAFNALFLNGMSRVDFFIDNSDGSFHINEINTIPGFTEISMFPKLWQPEISFKQLVTMLIEYGFEYFEHNRV